MIRDFLFALQFLTVIPVLSQKSASFAMAYFPLVGILLGLILVGLNTVLSSLGIAPILIAALLVVVLIILTGGLHLDGLADTLDAFLSGKKDKDSILGILRDPHIGTMGVLGIISVILLKFAILCSLDSGAKSIALILMCFLSRSLLILPLSLFKYARPEGKAKIFFSSLSLKQSALLGVLVLLTSIIIAGYKGAILFGISALFTYLLNNRVDKRINGVTGDILGASVELTEILILLLWYATAGI